MRILIAEDDLSTRTMLEAILNKLDFSVVSTVNGTEAWEALQADDAPRIALLDWMMPGMDGIEVCKKIKQIPSHEPIYTIILTIKESPKDIIAGLNAGADDYIVKPFNVGELKARIDVGVRVVELQSSLAKRILDLQNALDHVKTLQGILPICMHCHKIRNDQESWERIEQYITKHTQAQFSHGICPECADKFYPEFRKDA